MLTKQGLRLGNYLQIGDTITQVEGVSMWDDLIQNSAFAEREITEFNPIDLCDGWILKLGFKACIVDDGWVKDGVHIRSLDAYIDIYQVVGSQTKHLQYIHELQNLYFALTGKELVLD